MNEFVTFNAALALISSNKETDINVKAIELIDLYLNGDIDLYIELSGKRGKRSFPYSPLPQAYNPLDDLLRLLEDGKGEDGGLVGYVPNELIEKSFVSSVEGMPRHRIKHSYDYECSYLSEDELYKLEGVFRVPLDEGSYYLERFKKVLFYGEGDDELSERGIDLPIGGVSRVASLDGQIWTLYSHEAHKSSTLNLKDAGTHPDIIFPDINVFLLKRDQVVSVDKVNSEVVKRPNAAKRNQDTRNQILEAALYELANNYKECLKSGVVMASKVVKAFTSNHKTHWPEGCGIDKDTGEVKSVPLSNERMEKLVRDAIRKKN
jgi:hypothetical protein